MRIYACQFDIAWEQPSVNHAKVAAMLAANPPLPGSLVLLPEMFATGFSMDVAATTDEPGGATHAFLGRTAAEFGIYLMGGRVTGDIATRGRNEAIVFTPDGRELTRYTKLHPFSLTGEAQHFASGSAVNVFAWGGFTVSPFICYDLRFPEVFRVAVRRGAQLMTVIANWLPMRASHWLALLRARAIENQAYVVGVNRIGSDPNVTYTGRSQIIDPHGEVLADGGGAEGLISAELDLQGLLDYRARFPAVADMREDCFGAGG